MGWDCFVTTFLAMTVAGMGLLRHYVPRNDNQWEVASQILVPHFAIASMMQVFLDIMHVPPCRFYISDI